MLGTGGLYVKGNVYFMEKIQEWNHNPELQNL